MGPRCCWPKKASHEVAHEVTKTTTSTEATLLVGIAAQVVDLTLLSIGQDFVGGRDFLELLLRRRIRIDVRVQLARKLAVCLLDFVGAGITCDAKQAVVVRHQASVSNRPT